MTRVLQFLGLAVAALATPLAGAQYTLNFSLTNFIDSSTFPFTSAEIGDVNTYGHVAFAINEPPSQRGVYLYTGAGFPIKLIDDGPDYVAFGPPAINCHGSVAVRAQRATGGDDMLHWDGGALPVVILAGNGDWMSDPAINDHDQVVFIDYYSAGELLCASVAAGVVQSLTVLAAISNPSDNIDGTFGFAWSEPRINNSGEVAYGCFTSLNEAEVRRITSGTTCVVFHEGPGAWNVDGIAISGPGFVGFFDFGSGDYRVGTCGPTSLLVNNPGSILLGSPLDLNWHLRCCWGGLDSLGGATEVGLYGGPFPATDKFLRSGTPFPPDPSRTVTNLVYAGGINNRGQVSFLVKFTDGSWAIGRADPLVMTLEPEGCPGLAPSNDLIADAPAVAEDTLTSISNEWATTDGPALNPECEEGFGLSFEADVWFSYQASQSGCVEVSLCDFADFDARMAVYGAAEADPGPEDLLACNDDSCGTAPRLTFHVTAGESYLIRVGGFGGSTGSALLMLLPLDDSCTPACGPDIDCNGTVDGSDLGLLLAAWGGPGAADLDGSGVVDGADLGLLLAAWT